MRNKYRIVTDYFLGYKAQFKPKWWPFWWFTCYGRNSSTTMEGCDAIVNNHNSKLPMLGQYKVGTVVKTY